MNKTLIGFAAALLCSTALSTAAFASTNTGGNNNCTGNCSSDGGEGGESDDGGQGGQGGAGGDGGQGGEGGEGGAGGNATGGNATGGNATGGNATGGNASNTGSNDSSNTNTNNNQDTNQNTNTNNNQDSNRNSNDQNQQQQQKQRQSIKDSGNSHNENDNSNSNNAQQEVNVNTYNPRAPVNTAYAAPLAVSEDTCMGSSSIGGQGFSFGLSIGTTWTDENCQRLKNSRQLQALGYAVASVALICTDEDVKAAMIAAGTPCPSAENRRTSTYVAPAPVVQQMVQVETPVVEPAVQQWTVSMAPIPDPVRHQRRAKAKRHVTLPPK